MKYLPILFLLLSGCLNRNKHRSFDLIYNEHKIVHCIYTNKWAVMTRHGFDDWPASYLGHLDPWYQTDFVLVDEADTYSDSISAAKAWDDWVDYWNKEDKIHHTEDSINSLKNSYQ